MSKEEKLKLIVERLKPYEPEKIILYGSYARGEERENSDIDIMIVKETKEKVFNRIYEVLGLLKDMPDVEPYVMTNDEINNRLELGDFFVENIKREGVTLYEKA